jgi:hypothetical protein
VAIRQSDFVELLERSGIADEGGLALHAGLFQFTVAGLRLNLLDSVDPADRLPVPFENFGGCFERRRLRPREYAEEEKERG